MRLNVIDCIFKFGNNSDLFNELNKFPTISTKKFGFSQLHWVREEPKNYESQKI